MIIIKQEPFFILDEEKWLNEIIEKENLKLIAITLHSISNVKTYYFESL